MKNWRTLLALLLLMTLTACDSTSPASAPTAVAANPKVAAPDALPRSTWVPTATPIPNPQQPGDFDQAYRYDGLDRTYILHLPPSVGDGKAKPLVLLLHGYVSSARIFRGATGLPGLADRDGAILAFLDGSGKDRGWNAGFCCGSVVRDGVDDAGYIAALIDELRGRYNIDPKQVYMVGHSNGAMMSYRFAAIHPDLIAAIVSISGVMQGGEQPASQPVSVMEVHGLVDPVVKYNGGSFFDTNYQSVPATVAYWVKANGCGTVQQAENEVSIKEAYTCQRGTAVVFHTLKAGGHDFPSTAAILGFAGRNPDDVDSDSLIWNFLKAHPKQ